MGSVKGLSQLGNRGRNSPRASEAELRASQQHEDFSKTKGGSFRSFPRKRAVQLVLLFVPAVLLIYSTTGVPSEAHRGAAAVEELGAGRKTLRHAGRTERGNALIPARSVGAGCAGRGGNSPAPLLCAGRQEPYDRRAAVWATFPFQAL